MGRFALFCSCFLGFFCWDKEVLGFFLVPRFPCISESEEQLW